MTVRSSLRGRPAATSHAEIERAAFRLFAVHGFEATTLEMIAGELGVSSRTVARYYPSKNDIPWGRFGETLDAFAEHLRAMPETMPLWQIVHRAVLAFNDFPPAELPFLRERMRIILSTPALQAHSTLRYVEWRNVVAEFVAERRQVPVDDLSVQIVANVSLGAAISAYEAWLAHPEDALASLLDQAMSALREHLAPAPVTPDD
ncbi:MAG: mycofactocin system transcriptional regulator [Nocardioides sp.]|uniref:mycofactocin system transcriptional regulator n=1 Tax=Nocardioides sp. TaxID=35761 RepID=UPI0039E38DE1